MAHDEGRPVEFGRCPVCGYLMLPVPALSPCRHDVEPEREPLEVPGTVYSWTRVRLGGADKLIAMVDFFDGQLRVTAPVVGAESISIGDQVRLVEGGDTPYVLRPLI